MAHANTEELIAAWKTLDARDLMILRKMARTLCPGTTHSEPEDLLHEAYLRALDGRRNWPSHVRFSVFLGNAMRSISNAERKASARVSGDRVDFERFMDEMQHLAASPSAQDEVEELQELRIGWETAEKLRSKLAGDPVALQIVDGLLAGFSPEEMREAFKIDHKTFYAAIARMARRVRAGRMH